MLFDKKYDVVTEAYIGKTSTLKEAENELKKVLAIIYTFDQPSLQTTKMVNYTSACRKFNDLLSKEFGTKILVNFSPQALVGDGYTFITSTMWDFMEVNKTFKKTGKIKSNERLFPIYVNISYSLINEQKVTSDELMGIILHEIGHNITHVPIFTTLNVVSLLIQPMTSTVFSNLDRFATIVENLPVANQIIRFNNIINKVFNDITGGRLRPLNAFYNLIITKTHTLVALFDPMRHFGGYAAERYSDSLATAYGYGEGLSRGLLKITPTTSQTTYNRVVNSNKFLTFTDTALMTFIDICRMITLTGVHPSVGHRIKNNLDKLERDLKTGAYPPEVKSALEADVATMRNVYENYLNASDFKKNEVTSFYRKYLERYGANPLRNIVLGDVFKEFEV